jgi:hypothetical protein
MFDERVRKCGLALATAVSCTLLASTAHATLIWQADPARGTANYGLTGMGNCLAPSSITTVNDPQRGTVFRYFKPADSNRCENHGIRLVDGTKYAFQEGQTYYLGWWAKLTSTANNNANFQWKSFGDGHEQNFPVVLKMINGEMSLMQRQPQGNPTTIIWRRGISANQWNHYVLGLHLSSATRGGWIEFWFNGVQQTFNVGGTRFACRTWDTGDHNCPKWGVYGGSGTAMTNFIDDQKVGTTFDDVAPIGTGPTATPTPTPTATPVPPTPTPTPTPTLTGGLRQVVPVAVSASTNDGNVPANTLDGSLATRWSANGNPQWIQYDLGATWGVTQTKVAWYQGTGGRRTTFDVQVSDSATGPWTTVIAGRQSSGTTTALETYDFAATPGRHVRIVGHGNTTNAWNSVTEVQIFAVP